MISPIFVASGWRRAVGLALLVGFLAGPARGAERTCASPSGELVVRVTEGEGGDGRLTWSLSRGNARLIEPSPLGLILDGVDLGAGARLGRMETTEIRETYPWRGGKATATNHCRAYVMAVSLPGSGPSWKLEVRVFDDGCGYRYRVPGQGRRQVQGEHSGWTLPAGAEAWIQTNTGDYEGEYHRRPTEKIPTREKAERGEREVFLGPPVTVELAGGEGYLMLTEAALFRHSGMTLRPTGTRRLEVVYEDDPGGFWRDGEIVSPWRATLAVRDLQALVASDLVPNLAEPPDPTLFPARARTEWIRPGRALITWCVFGNDGAQWHLQKWFVDQCAALHCEYLLVDAGWRTERWGWLAGGGDVWARLRELCDYAAGRGVGIVVWHAFPEGRDDGPGLTRPEERRELFRRCRDAGVKGVKIDFFNSERLEVVEVYEEFLRLGAEHRLLVNFHGAHKPTGEVRTWPNEITREGIREQEYVLWDKLPLEHYAALPFTRMAVGHSDFLPGYVRAKYLRNTTAVFQMATAVIATSSFLCWPDHPEDYRASPFLGLVQALPVVWEETRVLAGSEIGRCVAFARRSGKDWWIGVLNGTDRPRQWSVSLDFLGPGGFLGTLYRDGTSLPTGVAIEVGTEARAGGKLEAELAPGGGFVGWLKPKP